MSTKELAIASTLDAIKQLFEELRANGSISADDEVIQYLSRCNFMLRGHWARDHRELSKEEQLEETRLRS